MIKNKIGIGAIFAAILLVSIVFVPAVSAQENATKKELIFGPETLDKLKSNPNSIATYGNIPSFETSEEREQWLDKLDKIYTKSIDKSEQKMSEYMYPNGPVIAYGYTIDGVLEVTIEKGQKIDTAKENEIYNLFSNYGQGINVKNTPLVFVYGDIPVPTSRTQYWRPVIGGIQVQTEKSDGIRQSTLGFAAKTSSGTKGYVVVGHTAHSIGDQIWQPTAVSGNQAGKVAKSTCTSADASWVPYTNVQARIYDHDTNAVNTVKSYGNPSVGDFVYKSGIATGKTDGTITKRQSAYDSGIGRTLDDQYFAGYECAHGDSGSPVFVYVSGGVKIVGIHWGGSGSPTNGQYSSSVFSSVSAVHSDLGVYPLTG